MDSLSAAQVTALGANIATLTPAAIASLDAKQVDGLSAEQVNALGAKVGQLSASAFDSLIAAIGTALEADRTLGGLCDWVEPEAPASVDLPIEGAAALKGHCQTKMA